MSRNYAITRRDFLKITSAMAAGTLLASAGCTRQPQLGASTQNPAASGENPTPRTPTPSPTADQAYMAVIHGPDPASITKAAVDALGGIERFVKSGDEVILKPNICVNYHSYEYAATTNPTVVATLVTLCLGAGARRVRVMDEPFGGSPESAYASSGIQDAVQAAGGEMHVMIPAKFDAYDIPEGIDINSWEIYSDLIEADVVINIPIAKHHSLAGLTLGGKNLMGVIRRRNALHHNLHQRIADLTSLIRPNLTVIDAVRILADHGPSGGSLDDVKIMDTVIASHDIVCADAYAATLFGVRGADIGYIQASADMGLGVIDWQSQKVEEINL